MAPLLADFAAWGRDAHHVLGQVLAGGAGVLLVGWHEPHAPRDLAAAICVMVGHRLSSPWALLVPLQNGQSPLCCSSALLRPSISLVPAAVLIICLAMQRAAALSSILLTLPCMAVPPCHQEAC